MDEKKGARKRLPSCLCSLFLFPFTAFLVVLVNPALPICAERGALSDRRDCFTLHFKVELRPSAVRVVIDSPVSSDPKVPRCFHRVNVCAEEQELPVVLCLLPLDHLLHPVAAVKPARILHSVRGDDEQRLCRNVLRANVLVYLSDVVYRSAHSVQQGSSTARDVLLVRHAANVLEIDPVVNHFGLVIEQDSRD